MFSELVDQTAELVRSRGRFTYRALKREFDLDDEQLKYLKAGLVFSYPEIAAIEGQGLVYSQNRGGAEV